MEGANDGRRDGAFRGDNRGVPPNKPIHSSWLPMATEITLDQSNPDRKKWRLETHCYGPRGCARYRAGKPRTVPGRQPGMVWVDDDVEREETEREFWAGRK